MNRIGVGIIGAGAATQAIHLPALATLGDRLQPVHIADPDQGVGEQVAARVHARWSADARAVIDDPAVDIVAICSPDRVHADQVEAACRAGKKAVLCEKPLAKTEADATRIAAASTDSGVPVIVGTMHRYDPAFVAARSAWQDFGSRRVFVRSAIYLPDNNEMTALATNQAGSTITSGAGPAPADTLRAWATALRDSVLGLAIHNLPLIRTLIPGPVDVLVARPMRPYGYSITFGDGLRIARLTALMPGVGIRAGLWRHGMTDSTSKCGSHRRTCWRAPALPYSPLRTDRARGDSANRAMRRSGVTSRTWPRDG